MTVLFVKTDVVYTLVVLFLTGLSVYGLIPNQVYTISVIPNLVVIPKYRNKMSFLLRKTEIIDINNPSTENENLLLRDYKVMITLRINSICYWLFEDTSEVSDYLCQNVSSIVRKNSTYGLTAMPHSQRVF